MDPLVLCLAITCVAALTGRAAILLIPVLRRLNVVDVPNARSSHAVTTPRGGGLAPVVATLAASVLLMVAGIASGRLLPVLSLGVVALAAVSLIDDVRSLPAWQRFYVQLGVVAGSLCQLRDLAPGLLGLLPPLLELPAIFIGWLWFVNLFNFMDGIDGITGVELSSIGVGILAVVWVAAPSSTIDDRSLTLAAALLIGGGLGFLWVNWSPARVFMGDVGSVPLGFMAGGALLVLGLRGQLAAAMILPAYYAVDATATLIERALNGESLTRAHRTHAYQRAVRGNLSHRDVCLLLIGLNVGLIGLALVSTVAPLLALMLAYTAAVALFWFFRASGT